jgi:hypothetical protein
MATEEQHYCEFEGIVLDISDEEFWEAKVEGCAVFGGHLEKCGEKAYIKNGDKWYCVAHAENI